MLLEMSDIRVYACGKRVAQVGTLYYINVVHILKKEEVNVVPVIYTVANPLSCAALCIYKKGFYRSKMNSIEPVHLKLECSAQTRSTSSSQ
jgi:hypothetical protein